MYMTLVTCVSVCTCICVLVYMYLVSISIHVLHKINQVAKMSLIQSIMCTHTHLYTYTLTQLLVSR